ncbi:MAG: zf-HC2 domain-containing protein [Acidimicrobiia bacterium]|nr:zf-HC2 domain-containing protein [Acidimicrobiia bacterium]
MTHDDVQDLLEDYVDERLDRKTRKAVTDHLSSCDECRSVIDGIAPIDLSSLASTTWDERSMRRAVRRSIFRTAVNAVGLVLVGWLIAVTVSGLVLQPLLINRGGRAAASTVATTDLAVLFNPGAAVDEYEFDSGLLSRTSSAHVVVPVGTEQVELGTLETRIGVTAFGDPSGGRLVPFVGHDAGGSASPDEHLSAVGDAVVATVDLFFDEPLSLERAQALADGPQDVRVVWAGFATDSEVLDAVAGPAGIGFGTCDLSPVTPDFVGSGGGAGSGSVFTSPPSIERARSETIRAVDNLIEHPELIEGLFDPNLTPDVIASVRDAIASGRGVASLVVTGPAPELRDFIASANPSFGAVRAVGFTNWFSPLCGR